MAWFIALQGPAHMTNQSSTYELQDEVDVEKIAQELVDASGSDRVVPIPAVLHSGRNQKVTLYVRPAAWAVWTFFELSDEDRKQLRETLNALSRAAQQRGKAAQQPAAGNPLAGGQMGPSSLGNLGIR